MSLGLALMVTLLGLQTVDEAPKGTNTPSFTRVHSTDTYVFGLVQEGYKRSTTFREIVEGLQRSNVLVMILPGLCANGRIRSCLVAVDGSDRDRHIRIKIDPRHTIRAGLIAAIAHELEHAVEIAEHPEVTDAPAARALYPRIASGRCAQGLSEECETMRALVAEKEVLQELLRR